MKALDVLVKSNGKIVSLGFTKKDGSFRRMLCRVGVHKDVKGTGHGKPLELPLYRVFDMEKNGWRIVNENTIEYIKTEGVSYTF